MADDEEDKDDEKDDADQPTEGARDEGFADVIGAVVDAKMAAFMEAHINPALQGFTATIRKEMAEALDPARIVKMLQQATNQAQIDNAIGGGQPDAIGQLEAAGAKETVHVHQDEKQVPQINLSGTVGQAASMIQFAIEQYMKLATFKAGADNPFNVVSQIGQNYPQMAPYLGAILAPPRDTTGIVNTSVLNGFNAGFKAGQSAGKAGIVADPLGPSANPTAPDVAPTPQPEPESVSMNGSTNQPTEPTTVVSATPFKLFPSFMRE